MIESGLALELDLFESLACKGYSKLRTHTIPKAGPMLLGMNLP